MYGVDPSESIRNPINFDSAPHSLDTTERLMLSEALSRVSMSQVSDLLSLSKTTCETT